MMRLICNENVPDSVVRGLRERGHDVLAVKESLRGAADIQIPARAQADLRLVVTQDKDFGELAFRYALPAESGVLLFRLSHSDPDVICRRMLEVISGRTDWNGQFAVATDDQLRMRPLPSAAR